MRKWLLVSVLALAGLTVSSNRASAWWYVAQPTTATVAFPMIYPSGYYGNTYYFPWYYPWYANYNYSHGWYSNWWMGGGYASYAGQQMPPTHIHIHGPTHIYMHGTHAQPGHHEHHDHEHGLPAPKKKEMKKEPGKVSIKLPADAKLTFNGVTAAGTGDSRVYFTPDLEAGRDYEYVLKAEVTRDGQTMTATERVIVRAGSVTPVTLAPAATASN